MATKPLTLPEAWATNDLYTTGPFIGQPGKSDPGGPIAAEGHRPGKLYPTAAEHENFQQNQITQWIRDWLYLGSSAGASDAHLVETTATGRTSLTGLNVTNTISESGVISITNGNLLPAFFGRNEVGPVYRAITINGPGPAYRCDLAATATGVLANMTGSSTGIAVNMTAVTGGSGAGLSVTGNATTTRDGVFVSMQGTAKAIEALSENGSTILASANGSGTAVSANSTGGIAVTGSTNSGPRAADFSGLGNADGVRIQTLDGDGLEIITDSGLGGSILSSTGDGLRVQAQGAGFGVSAITQSGPALQANSISGYGADIISNSGTGARIVSLSGNGAVISSQDVFGATIDSTNFVGAQIETVNGPYAVGGRATAGTGRAFQGQTAGGTVYYGIAGGSARGMELFATTGVGAFIQTTTGDALNTQTTNGDTFQGTTSGTGRGAVISTNSGTGVLVSSNTGIGVDVATDGVGVRTTSQANNAILAQSNNSTNPCIKATSTGHYALELQGDTTSPVRGAIRVIGQNARPTLDDNGQMTYLSTENQWAVSDEDDNGWRGIWTSTGGGGLARASGGSILVNDGVGYVNVLTLTSTAGNSPKVVGRRVFLRCHFTVIPLASEGTIFSVVFRVIDQNDGGASVYSGLTRLRSNDGSQPLTPISFTAYPLLAVAGPVNYRLEVQASGADTQIGSTSMEFIGTT